MMRSELGYSTRENIYVQGRDLCGELIGHVDLGAMAFLRSEEHTSELQSR